MDFNLLLHQNHKSGADHGSAGGCQTFLLDEGLYWQLIRMSERPLDDVDPIWTDRTTTERPL